MSHTESHDQMSMGNQDHCNLSLPEWHSRGQLPTSGAYKEGVTKSCSHIFFFFLLLFPQYFSFLLVNTSGFPLWTPHSLDTARRFGRPLSKVCCQFPLSSTNGWACFSNIANPVVTDRNFNLKQRDRKTLNN